jgi:transposase
MPPVNRNQPIRAVSSESQYSLMEFVARFPDDAACLEHLWRTRYSIDGEHAVCPKCEVERPFKRYGMASRNTAWTCTACGTHIHPLAGTIFHKSSTSLHLWFYAMYIMASTRCGVSAKQLERELGVTYKTAWRMFHLIRNQLMTQDDAPLSGDVEMDETYVGGRPRVGDRRYYDDGQAKRGQQPKAIRKRVTVFGAVERGGRVRAEALPKDVPERLLDRAKTFVLPEAVVFTDEYKPYDRAGAHFAGHHRIRHRARVYVSGDVHTQTIEGFWSLVKRGISGAHHAVSAKHLQGYLNEYAWRYNFRDDPRAMFELLLARAALPL